MSEDYYLPISIDLVENFYSYDVKGHLPAHDLVIRPLLGNCIYCYVYGLKNDDELYINNLEILIKEKGKHKFDLSKECITGHEYLWNVSGGKRGSIIIILENRLAIFEKITKYMFLDIKFIDDFTMCNPNAWNTLSATKKCREEMGKENIAACLTRNNGIKTMFVYANEKDKSKLIKMIVGNSIKVGGAGRDRKKLRNA